MSILAIVTKCCIGYIAIKSPDDSMDKKDIVWTFAAVPDGKDNIRTDLHFEDLMKYYSLRVLQQHDQAITMLPDSRKVLKQWDEIRQGGPSHGSHQREDTAVSRASTERAVGYDEELATQLHDLVQEGDYLRLFGLLQRRWDIPLLASWMDAFVSGKFGDVNALMEARQKQICSFDDADEDDADEDGEGDGDQEEDEPIDLTLPSGKRKCALSYYFLLLFFTTRVVPCNLLA